MVLHGPAYYDQEGLPWGRYVISRHKREVLIEPINASESDVQSAWYEVASEDEDEARTFPLKKEERKVLLELYYLGKVLRAYRRPWAFGSPALKRVIERITNKELLDQLEQQLRRENGFEEIFRIGAAGTVPDPMLVQLANDYRLLSPIIVRTLRKLLSLKHGLKISDKEDVIGELLLDQQREWKSLQQAVNSLEGDVVPVVVQHEKHATVPKDPVDYEPTELDVVHPPPIVPVDESENDLHQEYQWADVKEPSREQNSIQWGPRPHTFNSEAYYNMFPGYKPSSSLWASVYGATDGDDVNEVDDTESSIQALDDDEPVNLIDDKNDGVLLVDDPVVELEPEVEEEKAEQHVEIPEDMVFESLSGVDEHIKPHSVEEVEVSLSEEGTLAPLLAEDDKPTPVDIPEDMVVDQFVNSEVDEDIDGKSNPIPAEDIPEDMVVSQFVDNNPEENFEEPVDENPTASLDDETKLTDTIAPEALVEIPDDMVFEALVDNKEEVTTPVAEVPWLGAELETPSEDIPNQTEALPYTFDEAQYEKAPGSEDLDEGRRNTNRRRPQHQQQQPQVPVVIIQQTSTAVSESSPSAAQQNDQIERAARELIAIELDKFLLLVEELSGVDGVSEEFDRVDRTRMIGWINQGFSPTVGLNQLDLVNAVFKLLNTKELTRGSVDLLAALEFLQSQLELQQTQARVATNDLQEDDYFARHYGVNGGTAENTLRIENVDVDSDDGNYEVNGTAAEDTPRIENVDANNDDSNSEVNGAAAEDTPRIENVGADRYVISRRKREMLIQTVDASESDLQSDWYGAEDDDEARTFTAKREERKVLLELYYIGKVLRAFRRPWAFGSPAFKRVIGRVTNTELLDKLERKLRREKGFEEIYSIGTDGTVASPMQVQLANDYRLLAPVLVRTLRRFWNLKPSLPGDANNDLTNELEKDMKEVERHAIETANEVVEYFPDDGAIARSPDVYELVDLIDNGTGAASAPVQISDAIVNLIASELDKFLEIIEELSGVAGIAAEFDASDRSRMIDVVKQRYNASVGLDQRYFIEAVRTLLTEKQLYEGRFELLETLDYVQEQLDILERSENQDYDYPAM
uniref:Uncharacterized protein n=1 Tax=Anopheles melas TaxID=34690 RepID=A0A182TZ91_9DIPT